MKTVFCSFGLLMAAVPVFAQNTGKDSIVSVSYTHLTLPTILRV